VFLLKRSDDWVMKAQCLRFRLGNPYHKAVWLVVPFFADESLAKSGMFPNLKWQGRPFGAKAYEGDGGAIVEVTSYGGDAFCAFHLPAHAVVELDRVWLYSTGEFADHLTILEAERLLVNGAVPLEKWLPYPTMSGIKVKAVADVPEKWRSLDWIPGVGDREDYRKEKVRYVKAEGFRRWLVKCQDPQPKATGPAAATAGADDAAVTDTDGER
jgi:hypothetical protein